MRRMGSKELTIELQAPIAAVPAGARALRPRAAARTAAASPITTTAAPSAPASSRCCAALADEGITLRDIQTRQSSLEDIFVDLVREEA